MHALEGCCLLAVLFFCSVTVKRPELPPCDVDGRSRNPLHYCYYYPSVSLVSISVSVSLCVSHCVSICQSLFLSPVSRYTVTEIPKVGVQLLE